MDKSISQSLILRQSEFIPLLIEHLKHNAEVKHIPARRRLGMQVGSERFCYLLLKGNVTVHRRSDDRLMTTATGPMLIGLGNLNRLEMDAYIKTLIPSEIAALKMTDVYDTVSSCQLWEVVAKHMMVVAGKLFHYSEQLTTPSSYDIVCAQLNELFNESPGIKNNTTAERYIREKTRLSRSGIMRILSALREGGYIELNRGILVNIIRLPERF